MTHRSKQVRPSLVSKSDTSAALAVAWSRVAQKTGKGSLADAMDVDAKTVNRAIIGETVPELHTALNSLRADPTALREVLALYGYDLRPLLIQSANDLEVVADISHLAGRWIAALADGVRDHRETCQIADAIQTLLPALSAVVVEADRIKGLGR